MDRQRSGSQAGIFFVSTWVFMALGLAMGAGCRTDPAIIALERENRDLEDEIYALQDLLDRTQDELEACRARAATTPPPRGGEAQPSAEPSAGPSQIPAPQRVPLPVPRIPEPSTGLDAPGNSSGSPPKLPELPKVELPGNPLPPGQVPSTLRGAAPVTEPGDRPAQSGPAAAPQGNAPRPQFQPAPPAAPAHSSKIGPASTASPVRLVGATAGPVSDNRQVRRISLHRVMTAGWDRDASPGDEGLSVLLEPRDAHGRVLAAPAPVVVVLVDPALPGDQARVARWDLSAADLLSTYRDTPLAEGFYLLLPWPDGPPLHDRLEVFVRYTTDDGRRLEARQPVHVAMPPPR